MSHDVVIKSKRICCLQLFNSRVLAVDLSKFVLTKRETYLFLNFFFINKSKIMVSQL